MSTTVRTLSVVEVEGLRWDPRGMLSLWGAPLRFVEQLDAVLRGWGTQWGAEEQRHPTLIAAATLDRIGWFRSFPHVATFAVALTPEWENVRRFADRDAVSEDGSVALTEIDAPEAVLTPAACYHVYPTLEGRELDTAAYRTTRAACHRREERYRALRRQWCFQMRELVAVGTREEVAAFLDRCEQRALELAASLGLETELRPATDPFFDPGNDPKFLVQVAAPLKRELVFDDTLALASLNAHRDFFGRAFDVRRAGRSAWSACAAFGLERWLAAVIHRWGTDARLWPVPEGSR